MHQETKPAKTPRVINQLSLRDLSASPDTAWMDRMVERYRTEEDRAILEIWRPIPCVPVIVA